VKLRRLNEGFAIEANDHNGRYLDLRHWPAGLEQLIATFNPKLKQRHEQLREPTIRVSKPWIHDPFDRDDFDPLGP
jgi:hypothetical protein